MLKITIILQREVLAHLPPSLKKGQAPNRSIVTKRGKSGEGNEESDDKICCYRQV